MSALVTILIGGSGTRLWPYSRTNKPKQFLPIPGNKNSMLQNTALRASDILKVLHRENNFNKMLLIGNQDYKFFIIEQMEEIGFKLDRDYNLILEPSKKSTLAPSIIACQFAKERNLTHALLLPSDATLDNRIFLELIKRNLTELNCNKITVFGIKTNQANENYGHISRGEKLSSDCYKVDRFIEKPDLETSKRYIEQGMLINSGIFYLHCDTFLTESLKFEEIDYNLITKSFVNATENKSILSAEYFNKLNEKSIDYSVIEKTTQTQVITADNLKWNDIGSWKALKEVCNQDEKQNVLFGEVIEHSTRKSIIINENQQQTLLINNLENFLVYSSLDLLFISRIDDLDQIKKFVEIIQKQKPNLTDSSCIGYRPWGKYENLLESNNFKVKRITILPGKKISLQLHNKRSEHWIVVSGTASVTIDNQLRNLTQDQSVYIPLGVKHRIENITDENLVFIEIQCGTYFGEDDIVRFDDEWGRK
jgi:mannose-1-phosphate guanylyltransferase/mannose-6-phosphate isomerase